MTLKFNITDEVFFFNDSTDLVESSTVRGIKVIATKIHADSNGKDVLDEAIAVYSLKNDVNCTENALFASKEECINAYKQLFAKM